jgi:hypothetical protein
MSVIQLGPALDGNVGGGAYVVSFDDSRRRLPTDAYGSLVEVSGIQS